MHQSSPVWAQKSKTFLGRGTAHSAGPSTVERGNPFPHPTHAAPSAPRSSRLRRSRRRALSALDVGAYGVSIRPLATPSGSAPVCCMTSKSYYWGWEPWRLVTYFRCSALYKCTYLLTYSISWHSLTKLSSCLLFYMVKIVKIQDGFRRSNTWTTFGIRFCADCCIGGYSAPQTS